MDATGWYQHPKNTSLMLGHRRVFWLDKSSRGDSLLLFYDGVIQVLSPWTGCDKKREGCGERKEEKKEECERQAEGSKEGRRVSGFLRFVSFFFFDFELACLGPSNCCCLCVIVQKVGRRVEHRCGQREGFLSCLGLCAVNFSSHRRSGAEPRRLRVELKKHSATHA